MPSQEINLIQMISSSGRNGLGHMYSFHGIGLRGSATLAVVASGISEAAITSHMLQISYLAR